jgi:ABC-type Fe3+-siderophore transport system permease subunit
MARRGSNTVTMNRFFRCLAVVIISHALFLSGVYAQTTSIIPANEATAHVNEWATVEGVVAKVFTSKSGNTFLNIGAVYPNQTFTAGYLLHRR